jgi:hypothetical protein
MKLPDIPKPNTTILSFPAATNELEPSFPPHFRCSAPEFFPPTCIKLIETSSALLPSAMISNTLYESYGNPIIVLALRDDHATRWASCAFSL